MRVGAKESEAYLAQWRRGAPEPCGDDLEAVADAAYADMLATYDAAALEVLVLNGGHAPA